MSVPRWGNVCGSRANLGWYITRPGVNLLSAALQPDDFLFDSQWPKLGNLISSGVRAYVPSGVSTVVTWPNQSTIPLVIAYWRKASDPAGLWTLAISAQGDDFAFTGTLGETFYVDTDRLVFHADGSGAAIQVRWRVYDRLTVPSGVPGAPRPRWILSDAGFYVTPPGITAGTAPAWQHLFHPDNTASQALASGVASASSQFVNISFAWGAYAGDYTVYAVETRASLGLVATTLQYQEVAPSTLRLYSQLYPNSTIRWIIMK